MDPVAGFKTAVSAAQAYQNAGNNSGNEEGSGALGGFADLVGSAIQDTVEAQRTAEAMSVAAASGERVPMNEVIQAVAKAELTLSTMMAVRDRAVEAYQEILRMPI